MMLGKRKLWIGLLTVPLLVLAADSLYWWLALRNLEQGFAAWEAGQKAAGWTSRHGPPAPGGWPLAATLTIPAMSIAGGSPDVRGRLAWSAETLVLRVALARPGSLEAMPGGKQTLRLDDTPEIPFTADTLRLEVPLEAQSWPSSIDVTVRHLRAGTPLGEASLQGLRLHQAFQSGDPTLAFSLTAEGVALPPRIPRPLGSHVASLAIEGTLSGPVPAGRTMAEQAAAWRDGGGSLEIRHITMAWGPLDLSASATLALDDQLQPMGAGSARLVGYAEALDALAAHAAISRSAATATKAVLSLMAHMPDDGSAPDVEVPLTLQYRTLSMRQVPLLRLPELIWP
jgi:hypothetical protein